MPYSKKEQEVHLSGFLEAISSLKDIITPNLGGFNSFFSITKLNDLSLRENIIAFLETEKNYYRQFREGDPLGKVKEKLKLNPITDPETELHHTLPYWCCDEKLVDKFGRNGYLLSEIVYRMICEFFKTDPYKLYTINSDDLWLPWNDMMSQDYVFETNTEIYILHLGEST